MTTAVRQLVFAITLLSVAFPAKAQQLNWAQHIAPIFYKHCTSCHHPGGAGHFSLINYSDVLPYSFAVQFQTETRRMPPWPPDPNYRHFKDERYMSDAEIQTIKDWFNLGAPSGDTTLAPPPPVYTNDPVIVNADLVLTMPTYTVNSNNDVYRCFVLPTNLATDMFITGFEVIPGNKPIVHHVLVYEDTTNASTNNDNNDPTPGYACFGTIGASNAKLIGGWVPGESPTIYPQGMGVKIHKNAKLVMQIHYPKNSSGMKDSTSLRIKLSSGNLREIFISPILSSANFQNGPLQIPANTTKTFIARTNTPNFLTGSLLSVGPHMHLIGRSAEVWAVTPQGDTIPLINIPNWNFEWQGFYTFQKLVRMPGGSTLWGRIHYDNTMLNPFQPSNPPKNVSQGTGTEDEMFLTYFSYLLYQPGDEDFVVDSSILNPGVPVGLDVTSEVIKTVQLYEPFPNPTADKLNVSFYLLKDEDVSISVYDINGRLIFAESEISHQRGLHNRPLDVSKLSNGSYVVKLITSDGVKSKRFYIAR
jgi:hypothetical protein